MAARPLLKLISTTLFLLLLTSLVVVEVRGAEQECERLKQSLTYTQEEAPRDLSGVLPVVVERVNRVLDGVVDVEVEWHGDDLHGRVGEHLVTCKVTRLYSAAVKDDTVDNNNKQQEVQQKVDEAGRKVVTQCFHVPFTILDTNECQLPVGHAMRHACHSSSICVNTIGSYECLCPRLVNADDDIPSTVQNNDDAFWTRLDTPKRSPWEVSFNSTSRTTCPSMASTHGCCPERVHTKDGASCRRAFRCPVDPCKNSNGNDCSSASKCEIKEFPVQEPNYSCRCPVGLMGNGHKCRPGIDVMPPRPKVMFDGVTPTEETVKNNYYCDCTVPIVDACSGFPPCKGKHEICTVTAQNTPTCACKAHYVKHEKYGCVDESPPLMKLNHDLHGDGILRLKQGDVYKEYAVDIQDENAEAYLRSLKIAYSRPLPHGCLTQIGEFHVNYTIAMPWTSPPYVRLTRRVIIEDFNECRLEGKTNHNFEKTCPELVPHCDVAAGAVCVNTIGSYTCKCPKYTTGDGFQSGISFGDVEPTGYNGGTGCRDTSMPIISLLGPNPKVLRVCECGGVKGILGGNKKDENDANLKTQQQKSYGADIKSMIENTRGAELCATHDNPNPNSSDCIDAYDETYKGKVNLSKQVVVGEPVQKSPLHWAVPYNVKDEAGNKAPTVWRDVIVEEVDLVDVEARVRREVLKERDIAIKRAVDKALEAERREASSRNARKNALPAAKCPKCPKCECTGAGNVDLETACDAICDRRESTTCPAVNGEQQSRQSSHHQHMMMVDDDSLVLMLLLWLEHVFPPSAVPIILFVVLVFVVLAVSRWIYALLFYQRQPSYYNRYTAREAGMRNQVTVYGAHQNGIPATPGFSPGPATTGLGGGHVPVGATAGSATPGGPPRASASLGGGDGSLFTPSPSHRPAVATGASPAFTNGGAGAASASVDIYASSPIITPSRTGDGVHLRRSPYTR